MAGSGTSGGRYYKIQSKFVSRDYPFADDARFRTGQRPGLNDILHSLKDLSGTEGVKRFGRLKVDHEEIDILLRTIGSSSDEPIEWPRPERRNAEQLARNCKKLAGEIERATHRWPFGTRMMYSDYMEWMELPRILRSYANAWEEQLRHPYRSARSPRNVNVIRLLKYVKEKTGRYHYPEVADLLNATDAAYGWETWDGGNRWQVSNLRAMIKSLNKQ
jgi:hypothetical protein